MKGAVQLPTAPINRIHTFYEWDVKFLLLSDRINYFNNLYFTVYILNKMFHQIHKNEYKCICFHISFQKWNEHKNIQCAFSTVTNYG